MRRLLMVMTLVLVLVLAAGCGSDGESPDGGSADGGSPDAESPDGGDADPPDATVLEGDAVEVQAIDNSFQPETARVTAGTEVTFVNAGRNDHNVVPEDEDAEWAVETDDFGPGAEASYTFDEPGVYRYYCSIHGTIDAGMPGVLVVD